MGGLGSGDYGPISLFRYPQQKEPAIRPNISFNARANTIDSSVARASTLKRQIRPVRPSTSPARLTKGPHIDQPAVWMPRPAPTNEQSMRAQDWMERSALSVAGVPTQPISAFRDSQPRWPEGAFRHPRGRTSYISPLGTPALEPSLTTPFELPQAEAAVDMVTKYDTIRGVISSVSPRKPPPAVLNLQHSVKGHFAPGFESATDPRSQYYMLGSPGGSRHAGRVQSVMPGSPTRERPGSHELASTRDLASSYSERPATANTFSSTADTSTAFNASGSIAATSPPPIAAAASPAAASPSSPRSIRRPSTAIPVPAPVSLSARPVSAACVTSTPYSAGSARSPRGRGFSPRDASLNARDTAWQRSPLSPRQMASPMARQRAEAMRAKLEKHEKHVFAQSEAHEAQGEMGLENAYRQIRKQPRVDMRKGTVASSAAEAGATAAGASAVGADSQRPTSTRPSSSRPPRSPRGQFGIALSASMRPQTAPWEV